MHACDRLNQLRFTAVQQREFIRVTLHCCALVRELMDSCATADRQEKRYNPYYTLVLNNLCAESYDHRFTLQYALWDFLRELAEGSKETRRRGVNVAKAMAYLIARGSIDLTAFKVSDQCDVEPRLTARPSSGPTSRRQPRLSSSPSSCILCSPARQCPHCSLCPRVTTRTNSMSRASRTSSKSR